MKYKIDSGHKTHLPICLTCGWRGNIEQTKLNALLSIQRHGKNCHPGENDNIRVALYKATHIIRTPLDTPTDS